MTDDGHRCLGDTADRFGCGEVEPACEDGKLLEDDLLVGRKQVVRPLDEVVDRSLPAVGAALRLAQHLDALVQPARQRTDADRSQTRCGQLQRQRNAVEPTADLGDGAVVMGVHHGSLCIGCCWALMTLLFVLGVMNLWWIALVAAVVLLEKLVPSDALTRALGVGLFAWGAGLLVGVA
jgi:hypothetical protein